MNDKVCKNCKWCKRIERNNGWVSWQCVRFPAWLELLTSRNQNIIDVNHYCGEWKDKSDD